jgi:hypothetical protein
MRKKINAQMVMLIGAVVLALLISGCAEGNTNLGNNPYLGGTKGVDMTFVTGSPPDEIFDNKQYAFSIGVQLNNLGEADLEPNQGYVKIEGISPNEYGVSANHFTQNMPPLNGAEKNSEGVVIPGDIDVISFDDLIYQQDITGNFDNTIIRAIACYNYAAKASANICLKQEAVDSLNTNDVCTITGQKSVFSSGSPIQITEVMQSSQGKEKIQLSFKVQSLGGPNDRFFRYDTECDRSVSNPNRNIVHVKVLPIDNNRINAECTGFMNGVRGSEGYVNLFGGEPRNIVCSFDTSSVQSDFETRVNVELKYRYMQFIEKPILIKDIGN